MLFRSLLGPLAWLTPLVVIAILAWSLLSGIGEYQTIDTSAGLTLLKDNADTISSITVVDVNQEQKTGVTQTVSAVNEITSNIDSLERMIQNQSSSVTQASAAIEEMIVSIASVNQSVDKMVTSFSMLRDKAQDGFI